MNTKELRIGNYVCANDKIVAVTAIDGANKDDIEIILDDCTVKVRQSKIVLTPVRLAQHIINELCCFKDCKLKFSVDSGSYFLLYKQGHIVLADAADNPLIHFWKVTCLHQLQNLYYSLTGKDLRCKL